MAGVRNAAGLGVGLRIVLALRNVAVLNRDVVGQLVGGDRFVGGVHRADVVDHHVRAADVDRVVDVRVGKIAGRGKYGRTGVGLLEGAHAVAGRDRHVAEDDVVSSGLHHAAHDVNRARAPSGRRS